MYPLVVFDDSGLLPFSVGMNDKHPEKSVLDVYHSDWSEEGQQGRMTQMNTWRTGTGFDGATFPPGATGLEDSTSWTYQEATGLLLSKTDDNARSVNYTYTTGGKLLTRVWARTPVITTTYSYDPNTAELLNVNYSDTTPDITFTYNRLGRLATVVDDQGTRTLSYNAALNPTTEVMTGLYSRTVTRTYATTGVIGRPSGLTSTSYSQTYGYDTKGRFNATNWTISAQTGAVTYGFVANSDLIGTVTMGSRVSTYTYEPNRNVRTQINNQFGATVVSRYEYAYNPIGQRTSVKNSGTAFAAAAFNLYGYNNRSELTGSNRYLGTNLAVLTSPVPAETRAFVYDPIGNRTNVTVGTNSGTFTTNNLNQYLTQLVPGGGTNTFTHDFDGNLTAMVGLPKNLTYVYNGENRLITVRPTTPILNDKKIDSRYDYQGRRVRRVVSNWNGTAWAVQTTKSYVYDGWNVIEEITAGQPAKYYAWGLDLSQSLQGAGGVGGLLAKIESSATQQYLYDGNGNVGQLINNVGGAMLAQYEYDPYGNSIVATGTQAATNQFRFSTKYIDTEYNLYYYGYRFYAPETGRWLGRDPIGEEGGLNIYGFVLNNPINIIDALGNQGVSLPGVPSPTINSIPGSLTISPLEFLSFNSLSFSGIGNRQSFNPNLTKEEDSCDRNNEMRVQLQRARSGITIKTWGKGLTAPEKEGVTTSEVLNELRNMFTLATSSAIEWFPNSESRNLRSAIIKVSQKVMTYPTAGTEVRMYTVAKAEFSYPKDDQFRVEVENIVGNNLRK